MLCVCRKFEEVSVKEEKCLRATTVQSPETVEAQPSIATRKAARVYAVTQHSVERIREMDLKMFPHKISVVHTFSDNKERQLQFTAWEEGKHEILFKVRFLDDA
jgi:hypothetical protein